MESTPEINVEGLKYRSTNILPLDTFQKTTDGRIKVTVQRTAQKQLPFFIQSGYGIELYNYSFQKAVIRAEVGGLDTRNLKLHAETEPHLSVNGSRAVIRYYPDLQLATVKIVFDSKEKKSIVIHN